MSPPDTVSTQFTSTSDDQTELENGKSVFLSEITAFRKNKIGKLRAINHWWNITFTVAGITFTLLVTVLGIVDTDNNATLKNWVKLGIGLS